MEPQNEQVETQKRDVKQAFKLGLRRKCPSCGQGKLFKKFTTINENCSACGIDFTGHRADDAPAYFTVLISGHIIIPIMLEIQRRFDPNTTLLVIGVMIAFAVAMYFLLPISKGALIGIQWGNKMHGFAPELPDDNGEYHQT